MFEFFGSKEAVKSPTFEQFQAVLEGDDQLASAVDSVTMGFSAEVDDIESPSSYDPELEDTAALEQVRDTLKEKGCVVDLPTLRQFIAKRVDSTGNLGDVV